MDIQYSVSKNNIQICAINSYFLHSRYDPLKEAQRFVENIKVTFDVQYIIVTGPALSYCAHYFRLRFPQAILIAIEYSNFFAAAQKWDYYFICDSDFEKTAMQILFLIGEEKIANTLFLSWQASEQIFPQEYQKLWHSLKIMIQRSMDILATNAYFNKRWLFNTYKFFLAVHSVVLPSKMQSPILIVASGPSLQKSLPFIKKYAQFFFIIAVSSSLEALLQAEIIPNLVMATDGGFWATYHLQPLIKAAKKKIIIPLATSAEAAIPAEVFMHIPIVPLNYEDGLASYFFNTFKIPYVKAKRNGTVTGTALDFACELTTNQIYCCGLDLSKEKGFAHTQPNMLEKNNAIKDGFFSPLATRIYKSSVHTSALDLYASWFGTKDSDFQNRICRIKDESDLFFRSLSGIREENWQNFCGQQDLEHLESYVLQKYDYAASFRSALLRMTKEIECAVRLLLQEKSLDENKVNALKVLSFQAFLQYKKSGSITTETKKSIDDIVKKLYAIIQTYGK